MMVDTFTTFSLRTALSRYDMRSFIVAIVIIRVACGTEDFGDLDANMAANETYTSEDKFCPVKDEIVNLTANVTYTSKGSHCPSSVQFHCTAEYVKDLKWYFDHDNLVSHDFKHNSKGIINVCQEDVNTQQLKDFCSSKGDISINAIHRCSWTWRRFYVISQLTAVGTYIRKFSNVSCAGKVINSRIELAKYFSTCNPEKLTLTYNITSINGAVCESIMEFTCSGTNVQFFQWTYNDHNLTQFINSSSLNDHLSASISFFNCTIYQSDISKTFPNFFNFESKCVVRMRDLQGATLSSIGCNSSAEYKQVDASFKEVVNLTPNRTLNGRSCLSGVEFICSASHVFELNYYFDNATLFSYRLGDSDLHTNSNLCDGNISKNHNFQQFCSNGGSLYINSSLVENGMYNVTSRLVTTGTYISNFSKVSCGGCNNVDDVDLTNFTLSCNPENITLTSNISKADEVLCDGIVKFTCIGTNVKFFQWMYGDKESLTGRINISSMKGRLNSTLHGVHCFLDHSNTTNTFADSFNFESGCAGSLNYISGSAVSSIGCNSNAGYKQVLIICENHTTISPIVSTSTTPSLYPINPWYKKLSFLDFFPFCNVSNSSSFSDNGVCFGASAVIAFLLVLLCCGFCVCFWCCRCCPDKRKKKKTSSCLFDFTSEVEDDQLLDGSDENLSYFHVKRVSLFFITKQKLCMCCKSRRNNRIRNRQGINYKQLQQDDDISNEETSKFSQEEHLIVLRNEARVKEGEEEREKADISPSLFKEKFRYWKKCPDLGSRLQKYWFLRGDKKKEWPALQFTAKKSKKCKVSVDDRKTISVLNGLFQDIKHPYLLPVYGIEAIEDSVSVVQKFVATGSIRDIIFRANPTNDWSEKYTVTAGGEIQSPQDIATCCRHILEALLVLYELGFPAIGQVHAGNVFCVDGNYILGGYENTLLGYRTSQYANLKSEGLLDCMDIIMLGHILYEMGSGVLLAEVCPSKGFSYEKVDDSQVRDFVRYVFRIHTKRSPKKAIKQIMNHSFLKDIQVPQIRKLEISQQAKQLLNKIRYSEVRDVSPARIDDPDLNIVHLTESFSSGSADRRKLERIGWRLEKVWALANEGAVLMSASMVPHTCPIFAQSSMESIKEVLDAVEPHPNIHSVIQLQYVKDDKCHYTISVEMLESMSLKDYLYNCNPLDSFENKYGQIVQKFTVDQIARCGAQVLDALLFLYNVGFPSIGHVTTGNIYLDGEDCMLGGFENVILGHRTESYSSLKDIAGEFLDVFMFGLVVFEMATGNSTKVCPAPQDYKSAPKEVKDVLSFIFELQHSVHEVRQHSFFKDVKVQDTYDQIPLLSRKARVLLQKVKKGKWRNQGDTSGKIKEKLKTHRLLNFISH